MSITGATIEPAASGHRLRGLYALTDAALTPGDRLLPAVEAALRGGAELIQYRDKGGGRQRRAREARRLVQLCRARKVPLIINDDAELAMAIGADGVHVGRGDLSVRQARAAMGGRAIIGASCYDSLESALGAARDGADYVAFGSFFPSSIKPDAVRAEPELLRTARRRLTIPIAAIGGIMPANGGALVAAGADMLAVITGVFGQADVTAAARCYAGLFAGRVAGP